MLFDECKKELVKFYDRYFPTVNDTVQFVEENGDIAKQKRNEGMILHQTQRLVTLADDIWMVRKRDALRVLFLLTCAEAVAKVVDIEEVYIKPEVREFIENNAGK